nr:PREDICTED: MORC family CW-type zinc finger protein 4 isoform X1 [Struthio camelus australis]XP_009668240.1 PREDICTED: MORC family CW-type zinc finger protein 4 isoform X1 [Struthio camelus australis]
MTPHKLHRMLSFDFTEKAVKRNHPCIGVYGSGFKSGSMRLGKDAIVFTKNGGALSVGLLSQTYLERVHAETVIVPLVPFNQQNKKIIVTEDSVPSLEAILQHTLFNTREELLAQFDAIPGKKGTRILIWNIRRNKDGKPELDFDTDEYDIRLADFLAEDVEIAGKKVLPCQEMVQEFPAPETEYSLRAYCSILYLKPRMQIILRQKKVSTQLISKSLANVEYDVYKPTFANKRVKITFGFNCKNKSHYGIMMYHNNRLIKSYEKVGCQRKGEGVGVIGVIECNFLKPAHDKQDFEESKEYRRTVTVLGQKLNAYWKAKMAQMNLGSTDAGCVIAERPDETWVQCEECLKWRKLPDRVDLALLPEKWFCYLHPLHKYRNCSAPEEQEASDEEKSPSYSQKCKKGEPSAERKRRRSSSSSSGESVEQQVSSSALVPWPARTSSFTCTVKLEPEEKIADGNTASPPPLKKITASQTGVGPQEPNTSLTAGKPNLTIKEELLEKHEEQMEVSPPDLTCPSPPPSPLGKSFAVPYQDREDLMCIKQETNVGGNLHTYLLKGLPGTLSSPSHANSASHWDGCCRREDTPASPSSSAGDEKGTGTVQGELENQMPDLVAERQAADLSVCVNAYRSTKDMDKRPFVAVVGVSKAAAGGEAPIQLFPFGWKERLDRPKVRKAPCLRIGDRGGRQLQVWNPGEQEDITEQNMRRAVENISVELKNISAERDLLRCKVEEIEHEKCYLKTEFLKSQQELAVLRAQETEGLYWSKKHMGYRQAEVQELKAKLERSTEEKAELMERLKETEMHLEVLREAQVSCRGPERGDVKSVMEKLKNLRMNVSWLLSLVLPHLELQEINFESDQFMFLDLRAVSVTSPDVFRLCCFLCFQVFVPPFCWMFAAFLDRDGGERSWGAARSPLHGSLRNVTVSLWSLTAAVFPLPAWRWGQASSRGLSDLTSGLPSGNPADVSPALSHPLDKGAVAVSSHTSVWGQRSCW